MAGDHHEVVWPRGHVFPLNGREFNSVVTDIVRALAEKRHRRCFVPCINHGVVQGLTVAAGDALLSPTITKRVIEEFVRIPRPGPPKELDELSAREREVFRLIANGLSNAEIGQELY